MRQAWRWFGPNDPVTLDAVRQAGATDIVSALHHVPPGEAWSLNDVERHRDLIEITPPGRSPLRWSVIESIPVADDIKRHGADAKQSIAAWIASLEAAAQGGLKIICYNFMPVVDWTRTDLDWPLPTGATALRFDQDAFAAFDLYILKRPGAAELVRSGGSGSGEDGGRCAGRCCCRAADENHRSGPAGIYDRRPEPRGVPRPALPPMKASTLRSCAST